MTEEEVAVKPAPPDGSASDRDIALILNRMREVIYRLNQEVEALKALHP